MPERYFLTQKNNNALTIGGVRSLTDFTSEMVSVSVIGGTVTVTGMNLKIARFDANEIEITGKIENVENSVSGRRSV